MLSFLLFIALCLPGTKSPNGLEICETCSKGYFEVKYGQTNCTACPVGFTTKRRGARELSDCKGNYDTYHRNWIILTYQIYIYKDHY